MGEKIIFDWNDRDGGIKWTRWTPRDKSAPLFGEGEKICVTGKPAAIGGYETTIPVTGGKTYRFDVTFSVDKIDDINQNVLNLIRGNVFPNPKSGGNSVDGITNFKYADRDKKLISGSATLKICEKAASVSVMLGLRYSCGGSVEWHSVTVSEAAPVLPRKAVIAVTKYHPETFGSPEKYMDFTNKICEKAASAKTDLLLFTEFANIYSGYSEDMAEEISADGATCRLISENAKKYNMYICAAIVEKRGEDLYNTAVIFDRNGEIAGKYSKVHLYFPEELLYGTVPGDEHPVFDLDFGRVGIVICYDNWFAESYRILGLKGAELVLLPNAGHEPKLLPARAIDNGVYIANSSTHQPSSVVNSFGDVILEIAGYNECNEEKALGTVEIDLSQRPLPHANSGGNMNGSPGGKRLSRNSRSGKLYEEILKEIPVWENRDAIYTWI